MFWGGAWRPVTNMFDTSNAPTRIKDRAAKAVLFVDFDHWVAVVVAPGDIHEEPGYKTKRWEMLH